MKRPPNTVSPVPRRWVVCAAMLAGCGGRTGAFSFEPPQPVDGGPADTVFADRTPINDRLVPRDRAVSPDMFPGPVEGAVTLFEIADTSGAQQGTAQVFFTPNPMPLFRALGSVGNGCFRYPVDEIGPTQYSAGKVTVQGPKNSFSLSPDKKAKPDEWLYPGLLNPDYFDGGSSIKVTAAGDQVPGFTGMARGVKDLKVTFASGSTVSRSKGYRVTFAKDSGTAWATVAALRSNGALAGNYRCQFVPNKGSFTIPATLFASIPTTADRVAIGVGLVRDEVMATIPRVKIHLLTAHLTRKVFSLN